MEEIWKDIENYEGIYQVSNLGRDAARTMGVVIKGRSTHIITVCKGKRNKAFGYKWKYKQT